MPEYLQSAIADLVDNPTSSHVKLDFVDACSRAGIGLETEYGRWLQHFLEEGSWLRTSAIMTQYRANRKRRVEVNPGILVPPVPKDIIDGKNYTLLWSRRWRNPEEHINIKEGLVILSSLK